VYLGFFCRLALSSGLGGSSFDSASLAGALALPNKTTKYSESRDGTLALSNKQLGYEHIAVLE